MRSLIRKLLGVASLAAFLSLTTTVSPVVFAASETDIWSFGHGNDGFGGIGGNFLAIDDSGNLYGTTSLGGTSGMGIVYEITQ